MEEAPFTLHVNGQDRAVRADPATPLLYVLRNQLGLNGPKFGCGMQQCGACLVLLDGFAYPSCQLPVHRVGGVSVTTLEGLTRPDGSLHPVQQALVELQAAQCGFCLNGVAIAAAGLLRQYPKPDEQTIRNGLFRVLCRCGTHERYIRAVQRAAELIG
ncbi:(2Fe-2S)-binding protein [Hymenobacter coalescens]